MKKLIISGALAHKPLNGGNAWSRLSWIQGFRRLGFQVLFVEQIKAQQCVDANGHPTGFGSSANLTYFQAVMKQFGLEHTSMLLCDDGQVWGLPLEEATRWARQSDLLFNFGGHLTQLELKQAPARRIYYDDDPGFTQFWQAAGNNPGLAGHDFYFTLGENIGDPDCPIPTDGIQWRHTRPPVVLADWPVCPPKPFDRFTTIASWRGAYGPIEHGGKTYGLKCHEFRKFFALPQRTPAACEVALQIHPADKKDRDALLAHGWQVIEPHTVAGSPDAFRRYVQNSAAEFSPAQGVYVGTNSGWFSDRTVRYLASGRPALVQETGFSRHIRTGAGLLSFRTLDEAIAGAETILRDYPEHCQAARQVAEEFFDSDIVIATLAAAVDLKLP